MRTNPNTDCKLVLPVELPLKSVEDLEILSKWTLKTENREKLVSEFCVFCAACGNENYVFY